jgi:hypothetical protein
MAVDTERRAKKSASRLEHSLLLQPINTTMSYNPSTHSPDHLADANSFQSPADYTHSKPILPGQDLSTHQLASKKRRSSKSKNVGELRRSTSTPHMRNAALGNSGDLSPTSNKPRNKLGYHRTSVACGKEDAPCSHRINITDQALQDTVGVGRSDVFLPLKILKAGVQTASASRKSATSIQ